MDTEERPLAQVHDIFAHAYARSRSRSYGLGCATSVLAGMLGLSLAIGGSLTVGVPAAYRMMQRQAEMSRLTGDVSAHAAMHDGVPGVSASDLEDLAQRAGVPASRKLEGPCMCYPVDCLGLGKDQLALALESYRKDPPKSAGARPSAGYRRP